jgi:FkbM family methyltransferase
LEAKLSAYLPATGFFVEAGAMDGFIASNTYYLERIKGWRGILVEPIPDYFRECVRQRPASSVFQCALVAPNYSAPTVTVEFAESMSFVPSGQEDPGAQSAIQRHQVPARTLASLLAEVKVRHVDFLSLDVEGYEVPALQGLDLKRNRPTFILVECLSDAALADVRKELDPHYELLSALTHRDHLFRVRPAAGP